MHIALAIDGRPLVAAVALPAAGWLFSTSNPPSATGPIRLAISRTPATSLR